MEDILWQVVVAGERPAVTVKVTRISGTVKMGQLAAAKFWNLSIINVVALQLCAAFRRFHRIGEN